MRRKIAGAEAKKRGQNFELFLQRKLGALGWHVIRIQDGCKTIGRGGRRLLRVRQPFDYVALGPNKVDLFFDCKRRSRGKRVVPSMFNGESTEHQIKELSKVAMFKRPAGFVVLLDEIEQVFFVPVVGGKVLIHEAVSWGFNPLRVQVPLFSGDAGE